MLDVFRIVNDIRNCENANTLVNVKLRTERKELGIARQNLLLIGLQGLYK